MESALIVALYTLSAVYAVTIIVLIIVAVWLGAPLLGDRPKETPKRWPDDRRKP